MIQPYCLCAIQLHISIGDFFAFFIHISRKLIITFLLAAVAIFMAIIIAVIMVIARFIEIPTGEPIWNN
jgi:hypothetical protein